MKDSGTSVTQVCRVTNQKGLHARAAAQIVTLSSQFQCEMILCHKNKSASGLSLIKLLTLDAPQGSSITIIIKGDGAKKASKAINQLFINGFGELDE